MRHFATKLFGGDEFRRVAKLALPITLVQISYHAMGFVDTVMAGWSDPITLASVGLGNMIFFSVAVFGIGIMLGMDALVSRAMGQGDMAQAVGVASQSFYLGIFAGLLTTLVLMGIMGCLPWLGVVPELIPSTRAYIGGRLLSLIPMFWSVALRSYLQGRELTRPVVMSAIAANIFNICADWIFLFGDEGLQQIGLAPIGLAPMGAAGVGWASTGCTLVLTGWLLYGAIRHTPREYLSLRLQPNLLKALLRQGIPVGFQITGEVSFFALMGLIIGRMGVLQAGAHAAAANLGSLNFALAVGAGSAGAVRVGHAMGQHRMEQARSAGLSAIFIGCGMMLCASIPMIVVPHWIAQRMSTDPDVIALTTKLLVIGGFFQVFDGMQGVVSGVLRGLGETRGALWRYVVGLWGAGLPLALLLGFTFNGGAVGVWLGITAGLVAAAGMLCQRFLVLTRTEEEHPHAP